MKRLFLLFVFSCSTFIFSNVSFAEWTKIAENTSGDDYYVNFKERNDLIIKTTSNVQLRGKIKNYDYNKYQHYKFIIKKYKKKYKWL